MYLFKYLVNKFKPVSLLWIFSEGRGRPNHEDAEDAPALVKDGKIVPKEADPYAAPGMDTNSIFSYFLDPKNEKAPMSSLM